MAQKHRKANNKYMKSHDKDKTFKYIMNEDANILY